MVTQIKFMKADYKLAFVPSKLHEDAYSLLAMYDRIIANGIATPSIPEIRKLFKGWIDKNKWNLIENYLKRYVIGCQQAYEQDVCYVHHGDIQNIDSKEIWLN